MKVQPQEAKVTTETWEKAYLEQSHDAAVGRLFRGIVHNLNGALQVVSLQADLFAMTLEETDDLLLQLQALALAPEAVPLLQRLQEITRRRREAVRQLQEKTRISEEIIRRTLLLPDFQRGMSEPYTLSSVVRAEVEFLAADSFFKHKVAKELELAPDLPPLAAGHLVLHQIVFFLLANSLAAVRGLAQPVIAVQTLRWDDGVVLVVRDNGSALTEEEREKIFAPFAATRGGQHGPELYLARELAADLHGTLVCEDGATGGSFRLTLPAASLP